nr:hypothetical protein [Tanacetum cinerariifolium]
MMQLKSLTFLKAAASVVSRQDASKSYQSRIIILTMGLLLKTATSVVSRQEAKKLQQLEHVANLSTYPSQHFNSFCYDDDDDEEAIIQVREYYKNSHVAITLDFSITDSLIMEDEHQYLLNQDSSIISSPKIDSLLEEFSDELAHIDLISSRINETDFDPEEEICLVERLFNDSSSLLKNESFHFDIPSSLRPPAKPPDDDEIELDTGILSAKVVDDIFELYDLDEYINLLSWNRPTLYEDDDDEFSIHMNEIYKSSLTAITPDLSITDSLIMEDEHLDNILEMELDKLIKSSVENLFPNPSESEDLFEDMSEDLSDI